MQGFSLIKNGLSTALRIGNRLLHHQPQKSHLPKRLAIEVFQNIDSFSLIVVASKVEYLPPSILFVSFMLLVCLICFLPLSGKFITLPYRGSQSTNSYKNVISMIFMNRFAVF
jgi:hypothetical protein